ncbi:MAG: methylated-DNA--[protein]-cysteine S-methyltransferase [Candidatus Desulforudaceae bacterium]|nr:methylated-DNA--[protein]-cysteine S-methyltransferase [Bacillota bacterium]MBV1735268.1 methylated-DNA--[protein]-cysteine S-methyltransferase [Desulforudis sp.]MBV1768637.1 methylated-DNA--[protein]-cysteine S-methyltransferase [Desulforudis sp.]MDP3050854.1 methylated-DNA--[protein]-cysteine S-methyltransferase [Eubacteriales bacterium]MDZ7609260.1 methylated-DNA--[protein]-cysteine S-methyltransferase [Eubacteriales bacterium]
MLVAYIGTPYGILTTRWSGLGLYSLDFPAEPLEGSERLDDYEQTRPFAALCQLMESYFAGAAVDFRQIPIDWSGYTPFQAAVLRVVHAVPYGQTISYASVAQQAGMSRAARAVGNAVGINRTPILIPCHRAVRADGRVGGFSGGEGWKERLLATEGVRLYSNGKVAI